MRLLDDLPSFSAVAAGETANLSIPVTATYAAIHIEHRHGAGSALATKAEIAANLGAIRLVVDGTVLWNITAANLIKLNDYYKFIWEDGVLSLVFSRPYFEDVLAQDNFALGTADIRNATLEVEIKSGVVSPGLKAWAEVFSKPNMPLGQFIKIEDTHYGAGASAGVRELSDLPVVGNELGLKALHFTTADISGVEIKANGRVLHDATKEVVKVSQNIGAYKTTGRAWQAGMYHLDFAGNRYSEILETTGLRDFRVKPTVTSASSFAVIHELVIGGIRGRGATS